MQQEKIQKKIEELFDSSQGLFGRVDSWGQTQAKFVRIGCVFDTDLILFLNKLSELQQRSLTRMLTYFEGHMKPLKRMLDTHSESLLDRWFTETAWSHFSVVIMFGLLEAAVKTIELKSDFDTKLYDKGNEIKKFLVKHISLEQQTEVVKNYKSKDPAPAKFNNFSEVIDDMWNEYRSGFIHSVRVHAVPLESYSISGIGTKKDPLSFPRQVAMYEWLILTWQAILNAYGYKGKLSSN